MVIEVESPALYIGTTLARFNSLGKFPSIEERLIICVRGLTKQSMHCFRINAGILSQPGLDSLSDLITFVTSAMLISGTPILLFNVFTKDNGLTKHFMFLARSTPTGKNKKY